MRRRILGLVIGVAVLGSLAWLPLQWMQTQMPTKGGPLLVEEDATMDWLEEQLVAHRGVKRVVFVVQTRLLRMNNPEPGRYIPHQGETVFSFLRRLRAGQQDPVQWVVKEGPYAQRVVARMAAQLAVDSAALLTALQDSAILADLGLPPQQWSIYLIPNTYEVYYTDDAFQLAERLKQEYIRFWTAERSERATRNRLNPREVSILASIVEAETKRTDEMPVVAGLYINRLKLGMPLQSDPTILFARRLKEPGFTAQRVYKKDLLVESPYNTYRNPGLPPGPIGVPSTQAIDAVLNPQFHTFLYMCADPNRPGYHQFASNLKGHEHNRQRYIRWLNQNNIQ